MPPRKATSPAPQRRASSPAPQRRASSPALQRRASSPALQRTGSVTIPTLENWKWTAGNTVTGNVYGKPGTPDGTQMMTSAVPPEGRLGTHVVRVLPRVLSPPPPLLLRLAAARVAACSRGSACERAADVRGRIVQVTESGSSYLLGKPEQVSGSHGGLDTAEQGLTTGEALTLLEKEAGIDCSCQSYLLHIKPFMIANAMGLLLQRLLAINALLLPPFVIFWLPTIILWIINLYWVSEHGSPLPAHLVSRMKLISTHSLKPWRSPVGFFVMHMLFISCGYSYRTPPPLAMWLLWYSVSELARHSVQCHVGEVCRLFKVHGSQREADSPCRQVRRLARISRRLCRLWRVLVPLARRLLCGACLASVRSSSCCRLPISPAVALPLPLGTCSCVRPSGIVCVRGSVRGGAMGRADPEGLALARVLAMRA
jgi:hypothetical protein